MMSWFPKFLAVVISLPVLGWSQTGDLPVAPGYEAALKQRGILERFLPVQKEVAEPSAADRKRGWLLYQRDRNFELLPNSRPAPGEPLEKLKLTATPGEIESQPFSVYALRDLQTLEAAPSVTANNWLAQAAKVEDVLFHPVQLRPRGKQKQAIDSYVRYPVFIRPPSAHPVPSGTSRLYWVTVIVPPGTPAGVYQAAIRIGERNGAAFELPLEVRVLPFTLTSEGVPRFGAFLSGRAFVKGEWALMKRYGMDALQWFWNSHPIRVRNEGGEVRMDFTAYDAFVRGMQQAGMRGPLVLSLGNSWLGQYEIELAKAFGLRLFTRREADGRVVNIMDMTDPRWEKPWLEGLRQIFDHAKKAGWPPLALLIHDEPTKYIMEYHPHKYHLVKKHFPEIPVYGVFFEPEKDPGPLLHSSDIVVANRDFDRMSRLAREFGKRFWSYQNVSADQSFGKCRFLYGQVPAYYGSESMFFWCWNYYIGNPWDDFDGRSEVGAGPAQSDADWVAVYPSVGGVEPVRTLVLEAAREAIDDVRYLKTLEQLVSRSNPGRWEELQAEIRSRQKAMFDGIVLDNRIGTDEDFFVKTRNDDVERLRTLAIEEILKVVGNR